MENYLFLPFETHLPSTIIVPATHVDVTKRCRLDRCSHLNNNFYFSNYTAAPLHYIVLSNAKLVNGTLVATQTNTCLRGTSYQAAHRTEHLKTPLREFPEGIEAPAHSLVPTKIIKEPCFLFNTLRGNYGHWHTQALVNCAYLQPVADALNVDIGM